MKINESYTLDDINQQGLVEYPAKEIRAKVYLNGTKVYFFEPNDSRSRFRLDSIINKRSFFL